MFSPKLVVARTLKVILALQGGVPEQVEGGTLLEGSPQVGVMTPARRSVAVRKAA
jgi:hypothetical protein